MCATLPKMFRPGTRNTLIIFWPYSAAFECENQTRVIQIGPVQKNLARGKKILKIFWNGKSKPVQKDDLDRGQKYFNIALVLQDECHLQFSLALQTHALVL